MSDAAHVGKAQKPGLFGSLKEALAAASRDDTALAAQRREAAASAPASTPAAVPEALAAAAPLVAAAPSVPAAADALSAVEAAREVRGVTSLQAPAGLDRHMEVDGANTPRFVRPGAKPAAAPPELAEPPRTQLVRGRQTLKRGQFVQDPVVGWLVIVGGPGLGTYRPVFEGNNTIGRGSGNRIPLDFGDDTISTEEQAYIRYDSADRVFLFVPNLSKTNIVQLNSKKPTAAVELAAMDVIVMGRTQLVFMPFCGPEFDWSEITETKD